MARPKRSKDAASTPSWKVTRGVVGGAAGHLLSFDPGHTTGWAWWVDGELIEAGQVDTSPEGAGVFGLVELFMAHEELTAVVSERYAIYPSKLDAHTLSSVYTLQVIGAIKLIAQWEYDITVVEQGAGEAKRFVTSDRLREWGMWQRSAPHANDAVRHGAFYLTFRG